MKAIVTGVLILLLAANVAQLATASAQRATDPEGVLRATIDAFNSGDATMAASFFAEDATATGLCPPANVCHGRAEIQGQLQKEIAEQAHDEIRDLTVNGNTVVAHLAETAPGFAEIGIERTYITVTATVRDGLITSLADELDLTDPQTAKFAQALQQEEASQLPASGTGYSTSRSAWPLTTATALLLAGGVFLLAGWRLTAISRKNAR